MTTEGTDTRCLREIASGNDEALALLWERYFQRVVALARRRLGNLTQRTSDADGVASSALKSFWLGVKEERFAKLDNREDIWQILAIITRRKVSNLRRYEEAAGRDWRKQQSLEPPSSDSTVAGPTVSDSREPDPQILAEAEEQCNHLLDQLPEKEREVALLRMVGFSNEQIASQKDVALSTVERLFRNVRRNWNRLTEENTEGKEQNS